MKAKNKTVANYAMEFYVRDHCTLCGNWGFVDTRGTATPAGVYVGRVNYCICPNGQDLRDQKAKIPTRHGAVYVLD